MIIPGPKRKIYRGGYENADPQQKELLASVAGIRPGQLVVDTAGEFGLAAAGTAAYVYIANAPMHADPLSYVYVEDETVFAYIPRSRDVYLVRAAAATYASDTPLAVGANGQVVAAAADAEVVGYAYTNDGSAQTVTAGQFIDMRIR